MGSAVVATAILLSGCALDAPFSGGEGTLTLTTEMNGEVIKTRGVPADNDYLRANCVVFIENSRGVMRKYKGVDNIPSAIKLSTGAYVCNAWSGDSVAASFSSKFYRGQQSFVISENEATSLLVKCNLANVVTSVDPASLSIGLSNLKVEFSTTRGSLEFNEDNIRNDKGYFMTPSPEMAKKDASKYAENTTMTVKITGTQADGSAYEKITRIKDVQRAHEYCVSLTSEPSPIGEGGALIKLVIKDIPIIEDTINVFAPPTIRGLDFNLEEQLINLDNSFSDTRIAVRAYKGLSSLSMSFSNNFTGYAALAGRNILDDDVKATLESRGIKIDHVKSVDAQTGVDVDDVFINFTGQMLKGLPISDFEYKVDLSAKDSRDLVKTASLRIANSAEAVETFDDVMASPVPDKNVDPMAVAGGHATLSGMLYNTAAKTYGFKYRKAGDSDWSVATAKNASGMRTRASFLNFSVTITGLETGTTYEYKAFADDFDSEIIQTFKTEEKYIIPNNSLEIWGTYSASTLLGTKTVVLPGATEGGKDGSFWGSGNEGSATANKQVLYQTADMIHSGQYAAKLQSTSAVGVIAAGNLFVGMYDRTDGTNGVLQLGRPYNGSHPTKLRVWAHYRPGDNVSIKSSLSDEDIAFLSGEGLVNGGSDHGQIYIALADQTIEVRTNPSNRKLFTPDDDHVLAYGEVTWKDNFAPDGQLQMIEITFNYKENAKEKIPTHMLITCCATKFGDYFSGSSSSVMYLDDFEFIYE